MSIVRFFILIALALLPALSSASPATDGWRGLPAAAYTRLDDKSFTRSASQFGIAISGEKELQFNISSQKQHANGDVSIHGKSADKRSSINATLGRESGRESIYGHMHDGDKFYLLTTDFSGSRAIELPATGITYNSCETEHHVADQGKNNRHTTATPFAVLRDTEADAVLDILLIYNQAFAQRYPGELIETRLNHIVQLANQAMSNSEISMAVRDVGKEFFDYRNDNTNAQLLNDMSSALSGQNVPGLEGLQALRDDRGADLVIMFRPHDIETRGSCGIAYFPTGDPNVGVNVVSDGMSSWSACLDDVMTHEIGHNLGAAHQAGSGGGAFDPRGAAFVKLDQFGTMMGSFGTGKADRFRGLPLFSNPDVFCGGQACGSDGPGSLANNAAVMRDQVASVTGYRTEVSVTEVLLPERSADDSDGDGTVDWEDHFPFDSDEQADSDMDGSGDASDAFPDDPAEYLDTDSDQTGDNADTDDDNDLVEDSSDSFPKNENESADDDGDSIGNNADVFPQDADEFADFDSDGTGDNEDDDDDNDGFTELNPVGEDVLVISVDNNRVLRFDAQSGASRGIEILPRDGLLTFQSALSYRGSDHSLFYTSSSAIKRFDLINRQPLGVFVPPYSDNGGVQLGTGFPTGIANLAGDFRITATLMGNNNIGIFRGSNQAAPETSLTWSISSGDAPIDIISEDNSAIILGQASRTLYRANALGIQFLGDPGAEWMQDPHRMALTGDGRLLVTDQGRNSVVAVDLSSGDFLGDVAILAEQGYSNPTGIAVTAEGQLLVAAADQNTILKYDLQSSAFEGELVASGKGGLSAPHAMTIVPRWLDRLGNDPDRVIRPNAGFWFNPATNGRGFDIEVFHDRLSAIWFTFDESGQPLWYLSAGYLVGFDYEAELLLTRLNEQGEFEFEQVGTLSLNFSSERQADMHWTIGESAGAEPLQWIEFSTEPADQDYTGQWGRADGPGWGVSLATEGDLTVAIAFIYDSAGQPRWTISDPAQGASPLNFHMNAVFSDSLCPTCSGESDYQFVPAGDMDVVVSEENHWSSDMVFPLPLNGVWDLDMTSIIRFSDEPQRPR